MKDVSYFWISVWIIFSLIINALCNDADLWTPIFISCGIITFIIYCKYDTFIHKDEREKAEQKAREEAEEKRRKEAEQESIRRRAEKCGRLSELEELYKKRSTILNQIALSVVSQPVPLQSKKMNTASRTIGATMVGGPLYGAYVSEKAEAIDKENQKRYEEQLEGHARSQADINFNNSRLRSIDQAIEKLISELPEE